MNTVVSAPTPGPSSRSARTTASPSRSSGAGTNRRSRSRSSTPSSTSDSRSTWRALTRLPPSTTRSRTRRSSAPPSATPARAHPRGARSDDDRSRPLRAPLEDARRAVAEPGDHRARQHDPQRRPADAAARVRRLAFEAAVDGRLLLARLRRSAARVRRARRPLRAQACAPGRHLDLRTREPRRPGRRLGRPGDRGARGDGGGGRADHARHPLHHRQPVHGQGAGKAIAIWAALAAVGIGLGPLTGGLLLEWFDWSSVFMVNVPFAAAALLLGIRYVPESRDPRPGSFDLPGAALSTAGFSLLVYAIIEAPGAGWTSGLILGLLAASVVCWRLPVVGASHRRADARPRLLPQRRLQRRHGGSQRCLLRLARRDLRADPVPAVRPRLQRDRGGRNHEPDRARTDDGRRLVEQGRRATRCLQSGRSRSDRPRGHARIDHPVGARRPEHSRWRCGSSASRWRWAGSWRPATSAVVGAVPAAKSGVASATNTVARMVSGALGVAVIGSLVSSLYSNDVDGSLVGLPAQAQAGAEDSVGAASAIAAQLPGDAASSLLATAGDAFTQAMGVGLLVAAALAAATAVVVLRFLPAREPCRRTGRSRAPTRRYRRVPQSAAAGLKGASDVIHQAIEQSGGKFSLPEALRPARPRGHRYLYTATPRCDDGTVPTPPCAR